MPMRRRAFRGFVKLGVLESQAMSIALIGLMGCSSAAAMRPPAEDSGAALTAVLTAVKARCPGLGEARSSSPPARDELFVEAVILEVSSDVAAQASLATLEDLPRRARVQLVAVPHVIAEFGHQTEMGLGSSGASDEQPSLVRWNLLPRRADRGVVLELELDVALPRSEHVAMTPTRTVTFAASARDNEPALARVEWDAVSRRSLLLLLRTFEIHGEEDLRAIFQCKMQQRARARGAAF
jgi:hypothetical protein